MKNSLLLFAITLMVLAFPNIIFGQAPNLGTTSGFALFTASGAFDNTGASVITGDVGSFTYSPVGFPVPGTVVGTIHNVGAPILTSAAADAGTAFGSFGANGTVLGTPLETYNTTGFINAGTYHTVGSAALNGDFTLDAQGDPNAVFVININGDLTVGAGFNILLINSASMCNVYWLIDGYFSLGAGSVFRGTVISSGQIELFEASSLLGRGLSTGGAIKLHNNVVTINTAGAGAAGTVSGTASVCRGQTGLLYSVPVIDNASNYIWTLPTGATITAGANTNSITVSFSASASGGNITVQGSSNCGTGAVSSNFALTMNSLPAAVAGANRTICQNTGTQIGANAVIGSTYNWSSIPAGFITTAANPTVTPVVSTTYTVTETNASTGCASSNNVVVTMNSIPAAFAGADRNICQNKTTQIGTAAVSGSNYNWTSIPAGFTSNLSNPSVNPTETTTYTVVETTAAGCTGSNSVLVSVNPAPEALAGAARVICLGSGTTIGGLSLQGRNYSWSSVPSGFASTLSNPTVTPLVTTTYTLVETNTATGCINSNSIVVTVNSFMDAIAGVDRTICLNASTQIGTAPVNGSTYSWSSTPVGFVSGLSNPTVTPLVTTIYTVIESIAGTDCSNSNSMTVTVNPLPVAIAGADRTICLNEGTQIGAAPIVGNTYSWSSTPAGFVSALSNPTVTPLVTTTYTVVEDIAGTDCSNSNSMTVTVNPLPVAIAGDDRSICLNSSTQIGAAAVAGSTYTWSSIPAGFTSTVSNPTVTPLTTTTYTVVETTATGCTRSNSVIVNINPAPDAVAGADRTICLNQNTQIGSGVVPGSTFKWTSVPSGFTSILANPTVSPLVTTTYTVVETFEASGCQKSNSVTVEINIAPTITTEPTDQIACVGNPVSFSVNASGTNLIYQWRKGNIALTNGGNISGANSATLTINPGTMADASTNYNVLISGACSTYDTSKNVSLVVNAAPSISTAVCVGSSVSFSASATGTGLTYQWRKGDTDLTDGGNISGANSASLTINQVTIADASPNYNVLINGACSPEATSLNVALVVNPALKIVSDPADQTACEGSAATFTVVTEGAGLTYQWRKGEVNLTNGGNISGATSALLTINPVFSSDVSSDYNVIVTGACSPLIKSENASLSLCAPNGNADLDVIDEKNAVTIYPNPFKSSIDIRINNASEMINYELRIYNILGEEVINTRLIKDITTLKTNNLPSGIYMYEVNSNSKTVQTGKLISK